MAYTVSRPPEIRDAEELRHWTETELDAISKALGETTELELRSSGRTPSNPREGMVVYADGTNFNPGSGKGPYYFDGTLFRPMFGGGRPLLTTTGSFFVSTAGNDTNVGSVGSPWLTFQGAVNNLLKMDFNGFPVSVSFAAGTYTGNAVLSQPFVGGIPTFVGDVATPTNVNWNTTGNTFTAQNGGRITLTGFNVSSSAGDVFSADTGASITIGAMRFGNCHANAGDMLARNNATIVATTSYSMIGTRAIHCYSFNGGRIQNVNKLVTLAGATTVSSSLAAFMADVDSSQLLFGLNFSGAVTGRGALAQAGGILFVNGDARWIPDQGGVYPGSVANVQQTGGLII